ncbi:hypothetical protein HC174_03275 [Salinimicrobium sp. CDJ15-81-2]|nr:hypothetical protein [Salinimicrobium nanhaiense]
MKKSLSLLFLFLLCISCMDDELRRPLASGAPDGENSTDLSVAGLPVHIDSTHYLIHPVGKIEEREGYYGSGSSTSGGLQSGDRIVGNFGNLRFQELNSDAFTGLTDQEVRIQSVEFLRENFENTGKQLLLYKLVDTDTNEDGNLNFKDLRALYISGIDGSDFRRISPAEELLQDYQVLQAVNRLYFRSMEDVNANGRLDADENLHYYYLDLASEAAKVTEYFPLKSQEK